MGTIYQRGLSRGIGAYLGLDSSGSLKAMTPEHFAAGSLTVNLTKFTGADVAQVYVFNDPAPVYKVIGNIVEFEVTPTGAVMVTSKQQLSLHHFIGSPNAIKVYLFNLPKFETSNLVISCIDFMTGASGPLSFCATEKGIYSTSLSLGSVAPFWVKGTSAVPTVVGSMYVNIAGEVKV